MHFLLAPKHMHKHLQNISCTLPPTRTSYLRLQTASRQISNKVPEPTLSSPLEPLTLGCCIRISRSSGARPAADSPTPGSAAPSAGPRAPSAQTPPASPAAPGASPYTPAATCHTGGTCGWCGGLLGRCRRRWRGRASLRSGGAGRSEGSWEGRAYSRFVQTCEACFVHELVVLALPLFAQRRRVNVAVVFFIGTADAKAACELPTS